MFKMFEYFGAHSSQIWKLTLEHIEMTAIAVCIAVLIGVPLGILISYVRKLDKPVLGLANVVTVFAMYALGPGATLCIVLVRVTLGCIATGQMMAFLFSMTGGLLAFCVSALLRRWFAPEQMWVVSVFAAVAHNLGQLAVAIAVMGTTAIGYYLPVLLISGVITGAFTGFCGQFTYARLAKSLQIKPIQ